MDEWTKVERKHAPKGGSKGRGGGHRKPKTARPFIANTSSASAWASPSPSLSAAAGGGNAKCPALVVDTGGLIKGVRIGDVAEAQFTIQEVLNEVRDRESRERLSLLPALANLKVREGSQEGLDYVIRFSKETGDYAALSATDIKVMALAVTLMLESGLKKQLRKSPKNSVRALILQQQDRERAKAERKAAKAAAKAGTATGATVTHSESAPVTGSDGGSGRQEGSLALSGPITKGGSPWQTLDPAPTVVPTVVAAASAEAKKKEEARRLRLAAAAAARQQKAAGGAMSSVQFEDAPEDSESEGDTEEEGRKQDQSANNKGKGKATEAVVKGQFDDDDEEEEEEGEGEEEEDDEEGENYSEYESDDGDDDSYDSEGDSEEEDEEALLRSRVDVPVDPSDEASAQNSQLKPGEWSLDEEFPSLSALPREVPIDLRAEYKVDVISPLPTPAPSPSTNPSSKVSPWARGPPTAVVGGSASAQSAFPGGIRSQQVLVKQAFAVDDGEGEWVTPVPMAVNSEDPGADGEGVNGTLITPKTKVAVMTTDFAMQNVLMQMGVHVVSIDGLVVRKLKQFVLRCYACYMVTYDMEKLFCPRCGKHCLRKTAVSVNKKGVLRIHDNGNWKVRRRGTQYSIPKNRGGRTEKLIFAEDQLLSRGGSLKTKKTVDLNADVPLHFEVGYVGKNTATYNKPVLAYGRRNINEPKHYSGRKKRSAH